MIMKMTSLHRVLLYQNYLSDQDLHPASCLVQGTLFHPEPNPVEISTDPFIYCNILKSRK